jgi:plastocyanin
MKTDNFIRNGIFLLIPVMLMVYGCNSQPKATAKSYAVEIKDMQFQPATLSVHKGDTVIWTNQDIVPHDVTENNKAWASPPLKTGESWRKVVTESASYYCSIHPVMKGELIVE